jgi:phenylpyruvate tautomerase PptA (4-oxalocrotonate tautomerase family)
VPFIHIKSLPFELDVGAVLEGVSRDLAKATGVELRHVHATWEFLQPRHYAVAGRASLRQPKSSHPLLVDLLAPDFNDARVVEAMLACVASSLAKRARVARDNIFINHRQAHSGMVFDAGKVERW